MPGASRHGRLWRALRRLAPSRAWFRRHLGRAVVMVNALFGAAQTGFGRLWRAKRWLAPSRPWLHEHFGRAAVKGGVFALFGAARTGPRRLWRALRRLAPSRPWLHEHFGRAAVTGAVFALFGAARTGPRRLRRALRRLAPSRPWFHRHLGWLTVSVGVIVLFGAAQTELGQRALGGAGVARSDPSYLELYFRHPTQLPSTLDRDQDTVLRFVVRSEALHRRQVGWYADVTSTAGRREVGHGRLAVAPGAAKTVVARLHVSCDGDSRVQLLVALAHSRVRIDQWLTCSPRGG